jgi:predicted nucleotidyltransferase
MSARHIQDPYRAVIQQFNRHGVRYVVVGMAGINYYATHPAQTFATMDYDVFIEPTLKNAEKAIWCIRRLGFELGTSAGPLKISAIKAAVRDRTTIVATTPDGLMVELLLALSGYAFSELANDAAIVTVRGVPVKVGRLTKLLRSKKLAGRMKDRQFLQRYQSMLEDDSKGMLKDV